MSNVLARKRKDSKFRVQTQAFELWDRITKTLLANNFYATREQMNSVGWIVANIRNDTYNLLKELNMNITAANSIYPNYMPEYHMRRCYQDRAICVCEELLLVFRHMITFLKHDANKYADIVLKIQDEINLIKKWRQSDNRMVNGILKNSAAMNNAVRGAVVVNPFIPLVNTTDYILPLVA